MSNFQNFKADVTKSLASEVGKVIAKMAGIVLAAVLVWVLVPALSMVWLAIPKWLVAALFVASLPPIIVLQSRLRRAQRRLDVATAQIKELQAPPAYTYKFGVKWDRDFNQYCPHCEAPLSAYVFIQSNMHPRSQFLCTGCGRTVFLTNKNGAAVRLNEAREQMQTSEPLTN
jgi:hypothetical protein